MIVHLEDLLLIGRQLVCRTLEGCQDDEVLGAQAKGTGTLWRMEGRGEGRRAR
jgi:hypothetical protein